MCNVCVAYDAINGDRTTLTFFGDKDGFIRLGYHVRAKGKAEFAPSQFQIKRVGEPWSKKWVHTWDLAGSLGIFDTASFSKEEKQYVDEICETIKKQNIYCILPMTSTISHVVWKKIHGNKYGKKQLGTKKK